MNWIAMANLVLSTVGQTRVASTSLITDEDRASKYGPPGCKRESISKVSVSPESATCKNAMNVNSADLWWRDEIYK